MKVKRAVRAIQLDKPISSDVNTEKTNASVEPHRRRAV